MPEQRQKPRVSESGDVRLKSIVASWATNPEDRREILGLIGQRIAGEDDRVTLNNIAARLHVDTVSLRQTAQAWGPDLNPVEAIKRVLEAVEKRDVENRKQERTESFRQELTALEPTLKVFAISLTKNEETAGDLVQDTLLRAWEHHEEFRWGELSAWVFSILKHRYFANLKTQKSQKSQETDIEGHLYSGGSLFPNSAEGFDYEKYMEVVKQLPPQWQRAYFLRRQGELTLEETASVLNIPVGTVKSQVRRVEEAIDTAFPELRKQR